jgi:hypothetical protein
LTSSIEGRQLCPALRGDCDDNIKRIRVQLVRLPRTGRGAAAGCRCPGRGLDGHGSWYLSLELPPGLDGRRRRIRRGGFPSRAAAEAALARLRMPSPGDRCLPPLTVGQWLERWLVNRAAPRTSTLRGYAAHVRLALAELLDASLATLDGRLANSPGPRCQFLLPPGSVA